MSKLKKSLTDVELVEFLKGFLPHRSDYQTDVIIRCAMEYKARRAKLDHESRELGLTPIGPDKKNGDVVAPDFIDECAHQELMRLGLRLPDGVRH